MMRYLLSKRCVRSLTGPLQPSYAHTDEAKLQNPTFGNGLRAWLAETENSSGIEDFRSAHKFARAMRSLLRKSSGELCPNIFDLDNPYSFLPLGQPDYPETARVSAEAIVDCVDDMAWSLNGVSFCLSTG